MRSFWVWKSWDGGGGRRRRRRRRSKSGLTIDRRYLQNRRGQYLLASLSGTGRLTEIARPELLGNGHDCKVPRSRDSVVVGLGCAMQCGGWKQDLGAAGHFVDGASAVEPPTGE